MFVSTAAMVSVLFSAIITERRRELGLLKAIGARRRQIIGMLLTEAAMATAVGGGRRVALLGVLLMRSYQHSLVYYLESLGIPFVWLDTGTTALFALAMHPVWQPSSEQSAPSFRHGGRAARNPTSSSGPKDRRCCPAEMSARPIRPNGAKSTPSKTSTSKCRAASSCRDRRALGLRQIVADGHDRRTEPPDARGRAGRRTPTSGRCLTTGWRQFRNRRDRLCLPVREPAGDPAHHRQCGAAGAARSPTRDESRLPDRGRATRTTWPKRIIATPIRPKSRPASNAAPSSPARSSTRRPCSWPTNRRPTSTSRPKSRSWISFGI